MLISIAKAEKKVVYFVYYESSPNDIFATKA